MRLQDTILKREVTNFLHQLAFRELESSPRLLTVLELQSQVITSIKKPSGCCFVLNFARNLPFFCKNRDFDCHDFIFKLTYHIIICCHVEGEGVLHMSIIIIEIISKNPERFPNKNFFRSLLEHNNSRDFYFFTAVFSMIFY